MSGIIIDHSKCILCETCVSGCPFGALENKNGKIEINTNCRSCRTCVSACPTGAISFEEAESKEIDISEYRGVGVYVEHEEGRIHPVTLELLGKARELAAVVNHKVYAIFIGHEIKEEAEILLEYGADEVYVYDHPEYEHFRQDCYSRAVADFIDDVHPAVILFGATTTGRSLAPTVAVRYHTGLTADTTSLLMREDTNMVQIRPAFGGNIMAQIITARTRPQFATVRYKVFDKPEKLAEPTGKLVIREVTDELIQSEIQVLKAEHMPPVTDISSADVLVVAGSGVRTAEALENVRRLADLLGGMVACTRPMVEKGIMPVSHQIGLSGRTVKPKLIITCGVSGAIQFTSGMNKSEMIISINTDENAPINDIAHIAIIGDLNVIVPELIRLIEGGQQ